MIETRKGRERWQQVARITTGVVGSCSGTGAPTSLAAAHALNQPGEPFHDRIAERRAAFARNSQLVPPAVMTSEGEVPAVILADADVSPGALIGAAASTGIVEGIAHVVHNPSTALLNHGEILVAPFTDPGWTPLFISAAVVVTEIGGVMTHGSVVAREYGIPAVVGVAGATTKIHSGQRIRLNGTSGYVEILDTNASEDELVTADQGQVSG